MTALGPAGGRRAPRRPSAGASDRERGRWPARTAPIASRHRHTPLEEAPHDHRRTPPPLDPPTRSPAPPGGRRPRARPPLRRRRRRGRRPRRRLALGRRGRARRRDGALGLRQVHPHARPRRPRPAHLRQRLDRRPGDHVDGRHRPHQAAAAPHRLRLPVLQPAADADGRGEHRPPRPDRRPSSQARLARRGDRLGRAERAPPPPAGPALRRPAAARRHRPGDPRPADGHVRRRADRQPRLPLRRRDPRAAAPLGRRLRPDHRHGDPRRDGGDHRRPDRVPGGRPHRPHPGPRARPRSWTRWRR